jgi:hypothetical protein
LYCTCRDIGQADGGGAPGIGRGDGDHALANAVDTDEVFKSAAGLYQVEKVSEGFVALEVELGIVCPDVFADFEGNEVVEGGRLALYCF